MILEVGCRTKNTTFRLLAECLDIMMHATDFAQAVNLIKAHKEYA